MFLISVAGAFAISTDGNILYLSFDDDERDGTNLIDQAGVGNWTANSVTFTDEGIINTSVTSADGQNIIQASSYQYLQHNRLTICSWYKDNNNWDSWGSAEQFGDATTNQFVIYLNDAGSGKMYGYVGNALCDEILVSTDDVSWYNGAAASFVCHDINITSDEWDIYVNGTLVGGVDSPTCGNIITSTATDMTFTNGGDNWDGYIDELSLWSRALSGSEMIELMDGNPYDAPPAPPAVPNATINVSGTLPSAGSYFNSLNVEVNATINSSFTTNCSLYVNDTYNQSNNFGVGTGVDVSFKLPFGATYEQNLTYYLSCYDGFNTSNSTESYFLVDNYYPRVSSNIENNLTVASHVLDLQVNFTDNFLKNISIIDTCSNNLLNVSADSPYYFSGILNITNCSVGNQHVNVSGCDDLQCTENQYNFTAAGRLEIGAYSLLDNSIISNYSVYVDGVLNGSTTNGIYNLDSLALTTYQIQIRPTGYTWATANVSMSSVLQYYNFSVYTTNSFNITFIDEETNSPVLNITKIEIVGLIDTVNTSTINGTLYTDLLTPDEYRIRYTSPEYTERFYYVNLVNNSNSAFTLYLIKNSSATEVTFNIYDEISRKFEGAYVHAQRYNISSNSFKTVEICKTSFDGSCKLDLVLNDPFYKFVIESPLGTIKEITSSTQVFETELNSQISTDEAVAAEFFKVEGVSTDLSFNNVTNTFILTYSDPNNVLSEMCLRVYSVGRVEDVLYDESCLQTISGTIMITVVNQTGVTYRADAIGGFSPTNKLMVSLHQAFLVSAVAGSYGLLLALILTLTFTFIGYYSASVALILAPIPLFFLSWLGMITFPIWLAGALWVCCGIVALYLSNR